MMLVLLGPPGSGKGTQAKILKEKAFYAHLSTGDMLRAAVAEKSTLGQKVQSIMARGELVPDDVVLDLIRARLNGDAGKAQGVVFDGFPRNISQAKALDELLKAMGNKISYAISIEIDAGVLVERITGRRTCKACGAGYHIKFQPPKSIAACDLCGGELIQRPDDKENVIKDRLRIFNEQTSALREYYQSQGIFCEVPGEAAPQQVTDRIYNILGMGPSSTTIRHP